MGEIAAKVYERREEFDQHIASSAPQWPIDKLNRIDLSILRLAVFELLNTDTPPKVVIDEAVELAKEFGSESSPSFINGVLGNILKLKEEKDGKSKEDNPKEDELKEENKSEVVEEGENNQNANNTGN
jgi:N utilization substance protein B